MNIKKELNKAKYDLTTKQVELLVELFEGEQKDLIEEIEEKLKREGYELRLDGTAVIFNEAVSKCIDLVDSFNSKGGAK